MKIFKLIICLMLLVLFVGCGSEYEVKFLGFDDALLDTVVVKGKDKLVYPEAPEVGGYTFTGWDKEIEYATSDTVIKAIYIINTFIVNFYDKDDKLIDTKIVNYGESASAPTSGLDVLGYDFVGWDVDFTSVKSNLDIKPIYEVKKFNVSFYNSLNELLETKEVEYGTSLSYEAPELTGHTFVNWDKDITNITSDLEVHPIYEKNEYVVTFTDKDGALLEEQTVLYGEKPLAVDAPEIVGYTFVEWDKDLSFISENITVKPVYKVNKYVVKFFTEDGQLISEQVVSHGEDARAPEAPEKPGYLFLDWDHDYTNVKGDLEMKPIYEEILYEVKFVDMYGTVIDTQKVKEGEDAVAPNPPYVDFHTFSNWDKDFKNVKNDITVKAIYTKTNISYSINDVNYWLQILSSKYDIKKTILTPEKIANYNKSITSNYSKTEVLDVTKVSKVSTKNYVNSMITGYSNMNRYTVYDNDSKTAISTATKNQILANRNLDNIPDSVNVKFGLIVDFGWLRSYPTNHYSNNYSMDRFQETTLNVGEGVAIYHESLDKEWLFVQALNYNGWIEKKYVAECSYDEMVAFLQAEEKLVVISDYVVIESAHVRMGQAFPLLHTSENFYKISFPTRNSDGTLKLKEISFAKSDDYNVGYLDYTYENVFKQAFKLLGIDYSWGDKEKDGRDCSSTMNAIYNSFGFMMPRNTSNQVAIPTYGLYLNGLTNAQVMTYKPGTLVFTSSHVMLYIGQNAEGKPYLLHNTNAGNGECILQSFESYGGSKMIGVLRMQ